VSVAVQVLLEVLVSVAVQGLLVGNAFSGGRGFIGLYWFQWR